MVYRDIEGRTASRSGIFDFTMVTCSDLTALTLFYAIALLVIYYPFGNPGLIRLGMSLVIMMFLPGYAFIAAIFPGKDTGILARSVLSFAFSIILVSLLGYGLEKTAWGVNADGMVLLVTLLTTVCTLAAYARRYSLPADRRFTVGFAAPVREVKGFLFPASGDGWDRLLSAVLICALLVSIAAVGYAAFAPRDGDRFTELYLCGADGKLGNYPIILPPQTSERVIVGVTNMEGMDKDYDLMVTFSDGKTTKDVFSESFTAGDNQTVYRSVVLKPDDPYVTGRATFSLYMDGNHQAPYRECYLLVNSSEPAPAAALTTGVVMLPGPKSGGRVLE
jgi:uncharacterized membrane protein